MAGGYVPGVLGSFAHIDAAIAAITALRAKGHRDLTIYYSHPNHELEEAAGHGVSPVRRVTLLAGMTGTCAAFGMQIWMNRDWPLVVGGKPPIAVPSMVVIGFELTVLIAALSTLASVVIFSILFRSKGKVVYHERFSDDLIGVFVPATGAQAKEYLALMQAKGAVEVQHVEG